MSKISKLKGMKEVRSGNLIATIKSKLPNVGFIQLVTNNDRKAFLSWRGTDFVVSSRLIVKELCFGRNMLDVTETESSVLLQSRLRG